MRESIAPKISKWPFFLGDVLLLGLAGFISFKSETPMGHWELAACVICVAVGAWIAVIPFLKQYQAELKLAESDNLVSAVAQIKNLEQLAAQIGYATSQWQTIREAADKTSAAAKDIAQGMAAEVKSFNDFIQQSNEGEKATLRLEVEKLRRAEVDSLQVMVRMLDHVFALQQAAARSRQTGVAEQLGKFQAACHDAARRIGLAPFVVAPGEPFDEPRHQPVEAGETKPPADATVEDTIASGFTFQGRLIRPAMVRLKSQTAESAAAPAPELSATTEATKATETVGPAKSQAEQSQLL